MKEYVTKKDKNELLYLWEQIEKDLKGLHKKHEDLKELKFNVICDNLNVFMQNEYWRRKYKKAPSYLCKLFIAIQYCRSYEVFVNSRKNEVLVMECVVSERHIELFLSIEDLIYMRDTVARNSQAKKDYNKLIKQREKLKVGDSFQIEPHGNEIYNPNYIEYLK